MPLLAFETSCDETSAAVVDRGQILANVISSQIELHAEYGGVVPDVFKPGIQVVVEGHLTNGLFKASSLLAKCPSKFQSATPISCGWAGCASRSCPFHFTVW